MFTIFLVVKINLIILPEIIATTAADFLFEMNLFCRK